MNSHIFAIYLLSLPPLLLAITFHEFFHGYIALRMGDPTAKDAGRLSFNPLRHIDPIGFIALILFKFGWARPVPITPANFYNYRQGMLLTSLAGPFSNFLLAVPFGVLLRIFPNLWADRLLMPVWIMLQLGMSYNLILCAFNLIPIPPLDGSKALFLFLPARYARIEFWLERYGFVILIGLMVFEQLTGIPIFWGWINPFKNFLGKILSGTLPII
jgi:Zn-dependent protease